MGEWDVYALFFSTFRTGTHVGHGFPCEGKRTSRDDGVLPNFHQMQPGRAIEVSKRIVDLPENNGPILLLAEGHELLDNREHLLLGSNGVPCDHSHIAFQGVADDRLA